MLSGCLSSHQYRVEAVPVPVEEELRCVPVEEPVAERQHVLLRPGAHQLAQPRVREDVEVGLEHLVAAAADVQDHGAESAKGKG